MADKRSKPPVGQPTVAPGRTENDAGKLGKDDLGNITWEWAPDDDLLSDDTLGAAERVRALVDPSLTVEDDDGFSKNLPMQSNPKGLKTGYNPYNSGALGKQNWKKTRNLHDLSKWIELRRKFTGRKPDDESGPDESSGSE